MLQQRFLLLLTQTADTRTGLNHCNHGNAHYLTRLVVFDRVLHYADQRFQHSADGCVEGSDSEGPWLP